MGYAVTELIPGEDYSFLYYDTQFTYTQFTYTQFTYTQFTYTQFTYTQFTYTQFTYTQFTYTQFTYTQLWNIFIFSPSPFSLIISNFSEMFLSAISHSGAAV